MTCIDARRGWRASGYGGPICCVVFDYAALSDPSAAQDPAVSIRPVTPQAAAVLRSVIAIDLDVVLAANTSGPELDRRPALRTAAVEDLFGLIVQSHDLGRTTRDPGFWRLLLYYLSCTPGQVMVVGAGAVHDVLEAARFGMPTVVVSSAPQAAELPANTLHLRRITGVPRLLTGAPVDE